MSEFMVTTFSDGASRGNPGHAGIGILLFDKDQKKILEDCRYLGITTNNEAEYRALLLALDHAAKIGATQVACFLDSELTVRQLNGIYKVKSEKLALLNAQVREKCRQFKSVTFTHVPREHPNLKLADKLANKGIDTRREQEEKTHG